MIAEKLDSNSPFNLDNTDAYERWRDEKLNNYPDKAEQLIVEINNPLQLTSAEHKAIADRCKKTNMTVYISKTGTDPDKRNASALAAQFGLKNLDNNMGADDDGITSLQVSNIAGRERYIPYSNKAIHWHTDGYYNKLDKQIHALNLHCVRPAKQGGENAVMDHEIAYIRLREENPEFIRASMQADAMIIPANIKDGVTIRPDRSGPVFSVYGDNILHMRYTERKHNVIWKDDEITQQAVKALETLLHSDDPYIYRLTLQPGWGLISNNVLHDRSGFNDDETATRLLYRLRYFDALKL
jgi:alpha-ketoglutarate-dependent taurine dioxygenase